MIGFLENKLMSENDNTKEKQTVTFNYLKSSFHRGVHVDGCFGGITPKGFIHMALFTERRPIPQVTVNEMEEAGDGIIKLGPEIREKREQQKGIIRECEVSLYIDPETAKLIRDWLTTKINDYDSLDALGEES